MLWAPLALTQTFEVNGQQTQPSATSPNGAQPRAKKALTRSRSYERHRHRMGQQHRSRTAWRAPRKMHCVAGQPGQAADFAQRAVTAAPGDNKLWFLLGYTSRMAGRYQQSLDAYQHGLKNAPGNADGMSGLAQTYAAMGRTDEALRLLMQVINANPHRTNDLLVAGQLYMKTGDTQQAANLLQRAEAQEPNAHVELMLGMALSQAEAARKSKQMLELARKHAPGSVEIYQAAATFLSRRARLPSRHRHVEARAEDDAVGAGRSGLQLRAGRRQAGSGECLLARRRMPIRGTSATS